MKAAIYNRATGIIDYCMDGPIEQVMAQGKLFIEIDAMADTERQYVVNGALASRPTIEMPHSKALAPGEAWTIACPNGTAVSIDGDVEGTVAGASLTLSFDFPAVYEVILTPPLPWAPARCAVTVG